MERATIDAWFAILDKRLAEHPLPTRAGGTRTATAGEFMLMDERATEDGRTIGFKHRLQRNYVFLVACRGAVELYVPVTDRPFMRGFFDVSDFQPMA